MAGREWTRDEVTAVFTAYRWMADQDAKGRPFEKAAVYRELVEGPLDGGRNVKSVQLAMRNVSQVLSELGMPWLRGFAPLPNAGATLRDTVRDLVAADAEPTTTFAGEWFFVNTDAASLGGVSPHDAWFEHGMAFTGGAGRYGERLGQLAVGDTVLMWANGLGVVGAGRVAETWDRVAHRDALVYRPPHEDKEYRVRVDWLADLRAAPVTASVLGFNPVQAVERVGQPRRKRLARFLARASDRFPPWWQPRFEPGPMAFVDAFRAVESRISEVQRQLLRLQYEQPERAVSGGGLAALAGLDVGAVNLHYGALGRLVGEALDLAPPNDPGPGQARWYNVLSWCPRRDPWVWQMQPPVAEALERLGWVEPLAGARADEVPGGDISYVEGALKRVEVNGYERDPAARRACIGHHGAVCIVCRFDFEVTYGALGRGYIHVHHLRPLHTLDGNYAVDPVRDLVPVCPNCHAMLHRSSPPLTPAELRASITQW